MNTETIKENATLDKTELSYVVDGILTDTTRESHLPYETFILAKVHAENSCANGGLNDCNAGFDNLNR